jgi:hypothetical protein
MVLLGFMADDRSTTLLRDFLKTIDRRVCLLQLGINRKPLRK